MDGYAERLHDVRIGHEADDLEREFEAALGESSTLAFRVAYSVLRHRQDAEDVAQEALVKAHRSFRQLRHRQRFRSWLVRMTWRLAIDRRRSDLRRTAREVTHAREQLVAVVPDESMAVERATVLWRAIDDLPEKLRVVIVLANMQEHDIAEVARLLDLPAGTVKSRLFLARTRLKEKLSCVLDPTNPAR